MAFYYPPPGFHFSVQVQGLTANDNDVRFTEVGGLAAELVTEEMAEGGENRYIQKYPTRAKYPDLTLKRGLLVGSAVTAWARRAIEDLDIDPRDVSVSLLNDQHQPLLTWHVHGAYATKWSVSDFNAANNAIVLETLQLTYRFFSLIRS